MKDRTYLVYINGFPEPACVKACSWRIDIAGNLTFYDDIGNTAAYFLGKHLIGFHRTPV